MDTIVFDKTGTLTHDRVVLRECIVGPAWGRADVLQTAARMSAASLHPVSRAITVAAQAELSGLDRSLPGEVQDVAGGGLVLIEPSGRTWRLGSAAHCGLGADHPAIDAAGADAAPRAYLSNDHGWVATFVMDEGVRDDAREAVSALQAAGLHIWVLSGDRAAAVQRVAQQLGINDVVAEATPELKLQTVQALQQQGARLAMVGDGLNDGPVLARADASFALGHGAPLTQAQSDFVVQSGRLTEVVETVLLARRTMTVVRQNLWWAAAYNAVCVPLALIGWMPPWLAGLGMAASSLLVIGNALRLARHSPVSTLALAS